MVDDIDLYGCINCENLFEVTPGLIYFRPVCPVCTGEELRPLEILKLGFLER